MFNQIKYFFILVGALFLLAAAFLLEKEEVILSGPKDSIKTNTQQLEKPEIKAFENIFKGAKF